MTALSLDLGHLNGQPSTALTAEPTRLPSIVLRDGMGRVLETDSSFQRAINAGRAKLGRGDAAAMEPGDWYLPHAPVPFKPDYSRVRPPVKERTGIGEMKKISETEVDHFGANEVSDRAIEIWKEGRLSKYRLSLLRDNRLAGSLGHAGTFLAEVERELSQTKYLPFTFSVPVGERSRRDQERDPEAGEYVFPGFCTGCQRTNSLFFCYGCERDPNPHYHQDKTGRTGGGFTYIRRDRPLYEMHNKNPVQWRTMLDGVPYIFYDGKLIPSLEKFSVGMRVERLLDKMDKRRLRFQQSQYPGVLDLSTLPPDQMYLLQHGTDGRYSASPIYGSEGDDEEDDDMRGVEERRKFRHRGKGDDEEEESEGLYDEDETDDDSGRGGTIIDGQVSARKRGRGENGEEEEEEEEEDDESDISFSPHIKRLYRPPKQFQLKKRDSKPTVPISPFSKNRDLNIPKYKGVDINRSSKKPTKFVDVNVGDGSWKAPDPFKLKDREQDGGYGRPSRTDDHSTHGGKLPPLLEESSGGRKGHGDDSKKTNQKRSTDRTGSPDSGVGSVNLTPVTSKDRRQSRARDSDRKTSATQTNPEDVSVSDNDLLDEEGGGKERRRKEGMKDRKRVNRRAKGEDDDDDFIGSAEETSSPEDDDPMVFREHTIPKIDRHSRLPEPLPLPKIDPPYPPKMMEFLEPVKPPRELSTTDVEVPPLMVEPPRQRPPPPLLKEKRKTRRITRPLTLRRPVGAPVAAAELKNIADPLDWLSKYCIIHPDRLPLYVRVFAKASTEQAYRYSDVPQPDDDRVNREAAAPAPQASDHQGQQLQQPVAMTTAAVPEKMRAVKTRLTDEEKKRIHDHDVVGLSLKPEYSVTGKNEGDLAIDKINYTLDVLIDKYEDLQEKLDKFTADKVKILVELTRKYFPEIAKPDYKPPSKKKKKKDKKAQKKEEKTEDKIDEAPRYDPLAPGDQIPGPDSKAEDSKEEKKPEEPKPFGDLDIIARLQDKHLDAFGSDAELTRLNLELTRLKEKLKDVDDRIDDLEDEKKLLQLYARDEFLQSQGSTGKPETFLRKQSPLYQKMHPTLNVEMNVSELEEALQQINGQLITPKEMQYILFILNVPGRRRIDVQLFSVIAALSEKVAQVDPFIRKLINKFDFEALNIKMERSKELFTLLCDDDPDVPLGKIAARMLKVELAAGGVSEEHTEYVLSKFNRENKGIIDFLDFLTYIPLFIEIHSRILEAPLDLERFW